MDEKITYDLQLLSCQKVFLLRMNDGNAIRKIIKSLHAQVCMTDCARKKE